MSEPLDDLVQRVLDGDAAPHERAKLEARLAADPAAKNRHDDMVRVFNALGAARTEDPPAGMRDDVLSAVRGAAPARRRGTARAGRPAFSWLRIALPAAGAVAALALVTTFWMPGARGPAKDGLNGTMGTLNHRATTGEELRLGSGGDAVRVLQVTASGRFQLSIRTGAAAVRVALEAAGEGTVLQLPEPGTAAPSSRLEMDIPANSTAVAVGVSRGEMETIRVNVTFPDGTSSHGQVVLRGLAPSR